jgi:acetoin utilization protein AcuB
MSIKHLISPDPVMIQMYDTLATVRDIFELVKFHHIIVVDKDQLVGIVSDRDYFKAVSPTLSTPVETTKDLAALNKRVHQIMSRTIISVNVNASVFDVISLFHTHKMSCLPVVDQFNLPIGIISWKNVIDTIFNNMERKQNKGEPQK